MNAPAAFNRAVELRHGELFADINADLLADQARRGSTNATAPRPRPMHRLRLLPTSARSHLARAARLVFVDA